MLLNHKLSDLNICSGLGMGHFSQNNPREYPFRSSRKWAASGGLHHALAGAVRSIAGAAASCVLTERAASGFNHNNAMNAAMRSHTIMAQKTLFHEPVLANSQAAPGPAKPAANPLAVYTIP